MRSISTRFFEWRKKVEKKNLRFQKWRSKMQKRRRTKCIRIVFRIEIRSSAVHLYASASVWICCPTKNNTLDTDGSLSTWLNNIQNTKHRTKDINCYNRSYSKQNYKWDVCNTIQYNTIQFKVELNSWIHI